ncbi:MAG: 7TM diverse intracellular signaling domain-containing protein [Bacteroidia bacterium]
MRKVFLLWICVNAVLASPAQTDTIYLTNDEIHKCSDHWKIFEDKTGKLSAGTVLDSCPFTVIKKEVANLGVSNSVFWLKGYIKNNNSIDDPVLEIPYPILDKVYFYRLKDHGIISIDSAGESFPFFIRKNKSQTFIFKLDLKRNEGSEFLLRINSGEQIIVPIQVASLQKIEDGQLLKDLFSGMYFGIVIVMILYNFFVYSSVRDNSYLYYIVFIFFVGLTQAALNGYGFKFLWPDFPWIAERSTYFMGCLSGVSTVYFARNFLHTKEFSPKFNTLLSVYILLYLVSFVLAILGFYNFSYNLINLNAGPGSLILLYNAFLIYKERKYRPALFFFIAFIIFLLSVVIFVLKDLGAIPYNQFTINGLQFGSAIEVTLLSFALADRINIFRKEKEEAQLESLQAAKENERIVREQNIILETKVTERTYELKESNLQLNDALDNLKQTQTQLVESEKMASLGQLTAGIAHEINNPINFVTSNIKPLQRDVDTILDVLNKVEAISVTGFSSEEKKQQIDELKKELDFDYLKTEIEFLLKGIYEGSSRTAEIVKGLRVFSRLDEDDLKRANINEGLDSTIILIKNQLADKILIEKKYSELPLIDCYPGKLNQVFMNVISNAIYAINEKFKTNNGGIITITTQKADKNLQVIISDNGAGMSDETKRKLFEPFFTTKPVGEGTGLGLSIVYNTIKKHNGNINVNSMLGEGTEFIIEIPLVQQLS